MVKVILVNEKTNLIILKISILATPFFLMWLFNIISTPIMVLLRFTITDPTFGMGVTYSIFQGTLHVIFTIISTYIAIYLWLKYVPKKEKL